MSRVFTIQASDPEGWEAGLVSAQEALAAGRLVVLPTETVYGIACRPDDPDATARLFAAKERPSGLNLPVLAASADEAFAVARRTPVAERLPMPCGPGR